MKLFFCQMSVIQYHYPSKARWSLLFIKSSFLPAEMKEQVTVVISHTLRIVLAWFNFWLLLLKEFWLASTSKADPLGSSIGLHLSIYTALQGVLTFTVLLNTWSYSSTAKRTYLPSAKNMGTGWWWRWWCPWSLWWWWWQGRRRAYKE